VLEEAGEDQTRSADEEGILFVGLRGIGEKGFRKRVGLDVACQFAARRPVWAPGIPRVEDDVAALLIVELSEEFAIGVVDDCGVPPVLDFE
jgi:hypothetical protein